MRSLIYGNILQLIHTCAFAYLSPLQKLPGSAEYYNRFLSFFLKILFEKHFNHTICADKYIGHNLRYSISYAKWSNIEIFFFQNQRQIFPIVNYYITYIINYLKTPYIPVSVKYCLCHGGVLNQPGNKLTWPGFLTNA